MGSNRHYPEEAVAHQLVVYSFWIDRAPVTNREFREFVDATGYVTFAEYPPTPKTIPERCRNVEGGIARLHAAMSSTSRLEAMVEIPVRCHLAKPYGQGSHQGARHHPVVHAAYQDEAYAAWAGRNCRPKRNRSLPRAADRRRGGVGGDEEAEFAWATSSRLAASTWRTPGRASFQRVEADGYPRTSPFGPSRRRIRCLGHDRQRRNGQWTSGPLVTRPTRPRPAARRTTPAAGRRGRATTPASRDPHPARGPRRSHLCAPNYCRRYRPAARHAEPIDTSTSHVGFRWSCAVDLAQLTDSF